MLSFVQAAVLLVLASPFILAGALLVKLTSRGPAFYLQTRLGKNGRRFRLIKLRTMIDNAEAETGPVWADKEDPRITRVGRFLRETHIDEFPQLVNVLLGHMSLVGPRPERPEFVEHLEWQIPGYSRRLRVRPGITGLAQLNLPADSDLEGVRRKLCHDLYYVHHSNPWLDLRIVIVTGWLLVRTMLKAAWKTVALPSMDKVDSAVQQAVAAESEAAVSTSPK